MLSKLRICNLNLKKCRIKLIKENKNSKLKKMILNLKMINSSQKKRNLKLKKRNSNLKMKRK